VSQKALNLANTSIDVEHQNDGDKVDNGKYVLGKANVSTSTCQPIKQREHIDKSSWIAAIINNTL